MKVGKLAWKNTLHRPSNLLLSLILFALGVGLINFLFLLSKQVNDRFEANLAGVDLVIGAKGSPLQLILSSMYHIDNPTGNIHISESKAFLNPNHPLIAKAVPLSMGDNYNSFRIVGTNHVFLDLYNARIEEGRLWEENGEVVIGKRVANELKLSIGSTFASAHGLDMNEDLAHIHQKLTVVGIIEPSGSVADQLILTNSATIWEVHDHEESPDTMPSSEISNNHVTNDTIIESEKAGHMSNTELMAQDGKDITSILIQYKSKTNFQALSMPRNINENTNLQAASPAYEINKLRDMVGIGTDALKAIAGLIAFVSAVSIFLSLYRSLADRRYELALIRVMGGSRASLFFLLILEGMFLALLGWFVGFVLSHLGLHIFATYISSEFQYGIEPWEFIKPEIFIFTSSIVLGLVAALIPAFLASKTDINKTLSEFGN